MTPGQYIDFQNILLNKWVFTQSNIRYYMNFP